MGVRNMVSRSVREVTDTDSLPDLTNRVANKMQDGYAPVKL